MNVVNKLLLSTAGLVLPGTVFAHPGHEHGAGALERIQHAVIGWDQLSLLLLGAVAAVFILARSKK